jgi:transposase
MVRERQHDHLEDWLEQAEPSELSAFHTFVSGLRRDVGAVAAALKLPYSNGVTEGHVHRLKIIKRSMYGRANFDLLQRRVLLAA